MTRHTINLQLGLTSLIVLLLAAWLRLTHLYSLPVFVDEGTHILWAQHFAAGLSDYPRWMDGRVGLIVWLGTLGLSGPAPLWVARAADAVAAILSTAACMALARQLTHRRPAALLAGLLYALLPFAVFHDRQALADPLSAAAGAVGLALLARAARGHWRWSLWAGVALAFATLIKFTSVIYWAGLLWLVLLTRPRQKWLLHSLSALGGALALSALAWLALNARLGTANSIFANAQQSFVTCPPLLCAGDVAAQLQRLPAVLSGFAEIIAPYFGWPLVALAALGILAASRRGTLWLLLTSLSMMLAVLLAGTQALPPRYFSFLAVPVCVLAALGLMALWHRAGGWAGGAKTTLAFSLAVFVGWPLFNSALLIAHPAQANLPALDRRQYFTGPYAGLGFREAAGAVAAPNALVVAEDWFMLMLGAYLSPQRVTLISATGAQWDTVANAGRPVYVIDRLQPNRPVDTGGEELGQFARLNGEGPLRVRRFAADTAEAQRSLFAAMFWRPEGYLDDYDRLIAESAEAPEAIWLAPFPPHQTAFVAERLALLNAPHVRLLALGGDQPWDVSATIDTLARTDLSGARLALVLLSETRLDPERRVETWLAEHRFRVSEQTYGALRVVAYAGHGPVAQTWPAGARFGEQIVLETVDALDTTVAPGGALRLRLTWRNTAPVSEALKVFVHLYAGEAIAAQYDGQPMGELRPTFTWQVGETIVDQLALAVPLDAPAGDYQIRVGLYDAATLARWPAQLSDGAAAEFFTGGVITIK